MSLRAHQGDSDLAPVRSWCPGNWGKLTAEHLIPNEIKVWCDVKARHIQEWTVSLLGRYSDSYASNQFRALQQFFKWHATEDPDEPRANPMSNLKAAKSQREARTGVQRERVDHDSRHL
jgi:site-specific recombinase XerD